MDSTIKYSLLIFLICITYSCNKDSYYSISKSQPENNIKILLRGPGTCSTLVFLNSSGDGQVIRGKTDDYHREKFKKFKSVEFLINFKIPKENLKELKSSLNQLNESNLIESNYANDARRVQIYIDNTIKVDVYTSEFPLVNDFLWKLSRDMPIDIQTQCGTSSDWGVWAN